MKKIRAWTGVGENAERNGTRADVDGERPGKGGVGRKAVVDNRRRDPKGENGGGGRGATSGGPRLRLMERVWSKRQDGRKKGTPLALLF
jgi:hypothetical protein